MSIDFWEVGRQHVRLTLTENLNIKICAKMVPKSLNNEQKRGRKDFYSDFRKDFGNKLGLLLQIVTGDVVARGWR